MYIISYIYNVVFITFLVFVKFFLHKLYQSFLIRGGGRWGFHTRVGPRGPCDTVMMCRALVLTQPRPSTASAWKRESIAGLSSGARSRISRARPGVPLLSTRMGQLPPHSQVDDDVMMILYMNFYFVNYLHWIVVRRRPPFDSQIFSSFPFFSHHLARRLSTRLTTCCTMAHHSPQRPELRASASTSLVPLELHLALVGDRYLRVYAPKVTGPKGHLRGLRTNFLPWVGCRS